MNKQQLASKIWESANKMRSKIEANEYKDYILGFIFYKFLSEKEEKYLINDLGFKRDELNTITEDDQETVENVQKNIGYFIGYDYLFSTWIDKGSDFNIADVRDALSAFERLINKKHKKLFAKIFNTLQTGLSKLGDSSNSQTKAVSDLIYLIKDIPMNGKQDYDVLGFIYEYLISNFAANAGKKAGEFYTPHEVSVIMSEIIAYHLHDRGEIKIYDPTSGSGSLLINIGKAVEKYTENGKGIGYYAQELKENTYNLTRMNLVMRGISPDDIETRNGDTLEEDWPYFDEADPIGTYEPLYVDAVVSNPPYSQKWSPEGKESNPRFANFGLAPSSAADYAFLLHDLYHLKSDGIMAIVLPHGVLFRGNEEGKIRENLIERNHIDTIIGLPPNIFFGTGIPTIIMILKQKRANTDVLFVDASQGFEKVGKNNKLRASDIKKIVDAVNLRIDVPNYSRVVSRDEIRLNEYNLNIPRYVTPADTSEPWDIYAEMFGGIPENELEGFNDYWLAFPDVKDNLFKKINASYYELKVETIKNTVKDHANIKAYTNKHEAAFSGFNAYLKRELIENLSSVNTSKEEDSIGEAIFKRLSDIPLVDKYDAYQILDDKWNPIAIDIDMIHTEGFAATKQVDPNMVIRKRKGKDTLVQEGWIGHIIPFDLVQKKYFTKELAEIKALEDQLAEIIAVYDTLLEQLPQEELDKPFIKEDNSGFVWDEVKTTVKDNSVGEDTLEILKKAKKQHTKETNLKKDIKNKQTALHLATKDKIESLTDEEVNVFLEEKWNLPLVEDLYKIPETIVNGFVKGLEALVKKYETTLPQIEAQITGAEKDLTGMVNQLTGDGFDMKGLAELKKLLGGV